MDVLLPGLALLETATALLEPVEELRNGPFESLTEGAHPETTTTDRGVELTTAYEVRRIPGADFDLVRDVEVTVSWEVRERAREVRARSWRTGNSHTGPRGNTLHWGAAGAKGEHRAGAVGGVALDLGSHGSIDAAAGLAAGKGPRGAAAVGGYFGPNSAGAGAVATNGELTQRWSRYVER